MSDLRRYSRQTYRRLIIGGILLLFGLGGALIYWNYGLGGTLLAFICLVMGLIPVGLIILILGIMEWIVERNREK